MEKVQSFGFLLADNIPGPFNLDIDYIKVSNLDYAYLDSANQSSQLGAVDAEQDDGAPNSDNSSSNPQKADPSVLTRHLLDPNKKREDFQDSVITNFGFGVDIGPGAIETAEMRRRKQWQSATSIRVDNPHWVLELAEDRKPRKKAAVQRQ